MEQAQLNITPLFQALARPPMMYGVTHSFMLLNVATNMILFIASGSFWFVGAFIVAHLVGKACCMIDANIFSLALGFFKNLSKCPQSARWGGNCYEAM